MYDLIIKNGKIIDGTGSPYFRSDVAIKDGKIVRIGKGLTGAEQVIDAKGLTVTPGFIDSHSHSDNALIGHPDTIEKLEQGITTAVAGQCGGSAAPGKVSSENDKYIDGLGQLSQVKSTMGNFLDAFVNFPLGANHICLIGSANLRRMAMGGANRKPTEEEMETMKALLREGMEHGALGISFGLIYPPSNYALEDEMVELAKVVAEYNGIAACHIRSEGSAVEEAQEEFISVVRRSGVRGVHSHMKSSGDPQNWGKVHKLLKKLEEVNDEGVEMYFDAYPYVASHTSLSVTVVPDSGRDLLRRLADPEEREKIKEWNRTTKWWKDDLSWVLVVRCAGHPEYCGLRIPEIAKLRGTDHLDAAMDIILESKNSCSACYFTMCEEDVKTVLSHPRGMICTDSSVAAGASVFHPRLKASFPRAIGHYAIEEKLIPLEQMIRKATSLPAAVYGLKKKGLIREGMDADICIFDEENFRDKARFEAPNQRCEGLNYVIVAGKVVVENSVYNGTRAGKLLLRDL